MNKIRLNKVTGVLTTLFVFSMVTTALAEPLQQVVDSKKIGLAKEKTEIQRVFESKIPKKILFDSKNDLGRKELADINSESELNLGEPYRVYFANMEFVNALKQNAKLVSVFEELPYEWEIPVLKGVTPIASFTIAYFDGKWQIAEVGGHLSPEKSHISSSSEDISELFKANGLVEADDYYHLRIPGLHIDLLFISQDNTEYFIPLIQSVERGELYGLKDSKVYTREQINLAVADKLGGDSTFDEGGLVLSGGPVAKSNEIHETPSNNIPYKPLIAFIALVAIGGGYFYKKRLGGIVER